MQIKRSDIRIYAEAKKVIAKYLDFGKPAPTNRIGRLVSDVIKLSEDEVNRLLTEVFMEFGTRHRHFEHMLDEHFQNVSKAVPEGSQLTEKQKKLIGAYFTMEYTIRSAALFNPSIVEHPDQTGISTGTKRFVMSLRAVGEGHISSVEFQTGTIDQNGQIRLEPEADFASVAIWDNTKTFSKEKLKSRTSILPGFDINIFDQLEDSFTKKDYQDIPESNWSDYDPASRQILDNIMDSNYDVVTQENASLSETVIFPKAKQECKGMEDVRFVEFKENGQSTYIGTYTAYNGHRISPQLIITKDFKRFKIRTMYGRAVNDKGFALFPEKINGKFAMLGRQGGENITIMYSDDLFIWDTFENIMMPDVTWSLTQIGNCGSPIKTNEGWLVLTHGVGPVRKYVISAILLDLQNPGRVIKKLTGHLISPNKEEREGYVPNVVYSCGAMIHENLLVIPYAMSDSATTFGFVNLNELLDQMENVKSIT
jgi:predicted GH43/DUF377 family glycosyl hydrolase